MAIRLPYSDWDVIGCVEQVSQHTHPRLSVKATVVRTSLGSYFAVLRRTGRDLHRHGNSRGADAQGGVRTRLPHREREPTSTRH